MTQQHPVRPPRDLILNWCQKLSIENIAYQAAAWGADQEFDACCQLLKSAYSDPAVTGDSDLVNKHTILDDLRAIRRPRPDPLVFAVDLISQHNDGWAPSPSDWCVIRDALAEGRRAKQALEKDARYRLRRSASQDDAAESKDT